MKPHRWFRFSLRTAFVVLTIVGVWLGWNISRLRAREKALKRLVGGSARLDFMLPPEKRLPIVWSILGTETVSSICLPRERYSEAEFDEIRALFPESKIQRLPAAMCGCD